MGHSLMGMEVEVRLESRGDWMSAGDGHFYPSIYPDSVSGQDLLTTS